MLAQETLGRGWEFGRLDANSRMTSDSSTVSKEQDGAGTAQF